MSSVRDRGARLLQQVGLPGVVLLAAVVADLGVILPSAFDGFGALGADLWLLPGILGFAACALWGRTRAVVAGWTGAAVFTASTVLIRLTDAPSYSTLLAETSFAECVAGTLLVYYCARSATIPAASVTIIALVSAELAGVALRDDVLHDDRITPLVGAAMLGGAILVGARARTSAVTSRFAELLRKQWLLVGMFTLTLFVDASIVIGGERGAVLMALPAIASAFAALHAANRPLRSMVLLAGIYVVSNALVLGGGLRNYTALGGLPLTATVAGMVAVALLVRLERPRRALIAIVMLSGVVAAGTSAQVYWIVKIHYYPSSLLSSLAVAATLLLGTSVAVGMFLRARDSERTTAVEAAVAEAQTAERMALARELHDIVAHYVTGIVVQAQAAKIVAERSPDVVPQSLDQIENAGTEALAAMRRLVRSMRGDGDGSGGTSGSGGSGGSGGSAGEAGSEQATTDLAADLRGVAASGGHGVPVDLDVDLPPGLPQEVARSALRIVQESLTNVSRHAAGATTAWVSVRTAENGLRVRVADDGSPGQPGPLTVPGGYGLVGMRERVELLGGTLHTGRTDGGWVVEAWLPLTGQTEESA